MRLTKRDWVEIFYALESKRTQILQGEYGEDADAADSRDAEDRDLTVKDWHEHLDHIMAVIGPDGATAVAAQELQQDFSDRARALLQESEDRETLDTGLALDLLRDVAYPELPEVGDDLEREEQQTTGERELIIHTCGHWHTHPDGHSFTWEDTRVVCPDGVRAMEYVVIPLTYPCSWLDVARWRGVKIEDGNRISGEAFAAVGISILNGCPGCEATVAPYNSYQIAADNPYTYCEDCSGVSFVDDTPDDRSAEPREFTETPKGERAREQWARDHDDLNGAPEGEHDR